MQVDNRWAESIVSDLVSISFNINHYLFNIKQQLPIAIIRYLSLSLLQSSCFPSKQIKSINMPRTQRTQNRKRIGYFRSVPTDDSQTNNTCIQTSPIKLVKHPTEQSSIGIFLKRLSKICFQLFISIPCVIFITLLLPISWVLRSFIRFTCRYHCTVTPCTCSYLSPSDLFWLYNSNLSKNRNKSEETAKLNSETIGPMAAAVFFLEGKNKKFMR